MKFAPITEVQEMTSTFSVLAEGETAIIHGIIFDYSNAAAADSFLQAQTAAGDPLFNVKLDVGERSKHMDIPFLADKGLQIVLTSGIGTDVFVTVYRGQIGA